MANITLQVLDGVDKGRIFRELGTPITIGREEGNLVRLNDERVSRFHAKVQQDQADVIITDLESTNGTRVNGNVVQIRRLRVGDCITVGRSVLIFGSNEEIAARMARLTGNGPSVTGSGTLAAGGIPHSVATQYPATIQAAQAAQEPYSDADFEFDLNVNEPVKVTESGLFIGKKALPPLPLRLSPSQAARLAEILDFLHKGLAQVGDRVQGNEEGTQITLDYASWQKIVAIQMLLARYVRAVGEPESWES